MRKKNTVLAETLTVGVAGHRDILLGDDGFLRSLVYIILGRLRCSANRDKFILLDSLAEGADTICAQAGLSLGYKLGVPLPMELTEYRRDFSAAADGEFISLLKSASSAFVVQNAADERERICVRDAGYRRAGKYVAQHCDVLLALWDGVPGTACGCGTAEAVGFAQASGVPVIQIITPHRKRPEVKNAYHILFIDSEADVADDLNAAKNPISAALETSDAAFGRVSSAMFFSAAKSMDRRRVYGYFRIFLSFAQQPFPKKCGDAADLIWELRRSAQSAEAPEDFDGGEGAVLSGLCNRAEAMLHICHGSPEDAKTSIHRAIEVDSYLSGRNKLFSHALAEDNLMQAHMFWTKGDTPSELDCADQALCALRDICRDMPDAFDLRRFTDIGWYVVKLMEKCRRRDGFTALVKELFSAHAALCAQGYDRENEALLCRAARYVSASKQL